MNKLIQLFGHISRIFVVAIQLFFIKFFYKTLLTLLKYLQTSIFNLPKLFFVLTLLNYDQASMTC